MRRRRHGRRALRRAALSPDSFAPLAEALAAPGVTRELLAERRLFERPPALFVADFADPPTEHALKATLPVQAAGAWWTTFPPRATVLGTWLMRTPDGQLLTPRGGDAFATDLTTIALGDGPGALAGLDLGLDWTHDGVPRARPVEIVDLDSDVLWVGPDESGNWGVWLLQAVPALRHAEAIGYDGRLLCPARPPWQRALVRAVAPRLEERMIVLEPGRGYRVGGRLTTVVQDRRNAVLGPFETAALDGLVSAAPRTGAHLFVSRAAWSRAHPGYRTLMNEAELIAAVSAAGFTVIEPETLSFPEQVAAFAGADTVVGLGGAGMFNTVFCRPGTPVMSIESSAGWADSHGCLFASRGLPYAVVFGAQEAGDGPHRPWRAPVGGVLEAIGRVAA